MSLYKADGDSSIQAKQKPPKTDAMRKYSTAVVPPSDTVVKRCSYVMINQTGSYAFSYESGSALITNATHNYMSASVTTGDVSGDITPFRLDINPVAWRRCEEGIDGNVGQVTFVYVRVR